MKLQRDLHVGIIKTEIILQEFRRNYMDIIIKWYQSLLYIEELIIVRTAK